MADVKYIITADTKGAVTGIQKVDESIKGMKTQAEQSKSPLKGMWTQVAAGVGVANAVTAGARMLTQQIGDMIAKGVDFGREWANVTTMLDTSQEETDALRQELQELSPTLGDTTELARGMYQVLSASVQPARAIEFLGIAAKAAKAGITETEVAVDALTTVINAYGLSASDATNVSDIMFATVKRGKLTYEEMAGALGTVVPVAAKVGIGFDEVAAAMATLTRQGIDANTATMQLRQVMMAVLNPSEDAREAAEELGVQFDSTALKTKGLQLFISDLMDATNGNNEQLVRFIPNVRALTGVMGLGGVAAQGFAADLLATAEASGESEEAFRKQMESAAFWIDAAKTSIDKLKIAFVEGFTAPLLDSIESSEDLDETIKELQKTMRDLGEIIGTILTPQFKAIVSDVTDAVDAYTKLKTALSGITSWALGGFKDLGDHMGEATAKTMGWNYELDKTQINLKELGETLFPVLKQGYQDWVASLESGKGTETETSTRIQKLPEYLGLTKIGVRELKHEWELMTDVWGASNMVIEDVEIAMEMAIESGKTDAEELGDVMSSVFEAMGSDAKEAYLIFEEESEDKAEKVESVWKGVTERLQDMWATELGEMLTGAQSFKEGLDAIWTQMKDMFFDIISKMAIKWATDFIGKMVSSTKTGVADVVKQVTGAGGGGTGGLGGLAAGAGGIWTGLGAAAGTFLGSILGPKGVSKQTGQDQLHELRLVKELLITIAETRIGILIDQQWARHTQMIESLNKQNAMLRILRDIRKNTKPIAAQTGFSGRLTQDTTFRAHAGETVNIQPPNMYFEAQPIQTTINLDGSKVGESLTWASKQGSFKIHTRGSKRY